MAVILYIEPDVGLVPQFHESQIKQDACWAFALLPTPSCAPKRLGKKETAYHLCATKKHF
jgi:hypothetical protein